MRYRPDPPPDLRNVRSLDAVALALLRPDEAGSEHDVFCCKTLLIRTRPLRRPMTVYYVDRDDRALVCAFPVDLIGLCWVARWYWNRVDWVLDSLAREEHPLLLADPCDQRDEGLWVDPTENENYLGAQFGRDHSGVPMTPEMRERLVAWWDRADFRAQARARPAHPPVPPNPAAR